MSQEETGIKWWMRYVVVPLIGGGGAIAVIVAYLNRPVSQAPTATPATESVAQAPAPTVVPAPLSAAPQGTTGASSLHVPEDVNRMWVFYQKPGIENQNKQGCSSPMGANPRIEPSAAVARISEFVSFARQNNVKLIFVAHSEKRGYVGAAEDMRFEGKPLRRNVSHWCDGEPRDGYEVPLK